MGREILGWLTSFCHDHFFLSLHDYMRQILLSLSLLLSYYYYLIIIIIIVLQVKKWESERDRVLPKVHSNFAAVFSLWVTSFLSLLSQRDDHMDSRGRIIMWVHLGVGGLCSFWMFYCWCLKSCHVRCFFFVFLFFFFTTELLGKPYTSAWSLR